MKDRHTTIQESIQDKTSSSEVDEFLVKQVDYIEECDSSFYLLKKKIPVLRELRGRTKLTISSKNAISRPYVWAKENQREDFDTYLSELCSDGCPTVRVVYPELDGSSATGLSEVQLEINSIDPVKLSKTVDQIAQFHKYYFDEYPGDGRFQTLG
ncbi:hypothetical protein [Natrinema saccharevitans]|uniref:hypothetical protein n=1 Tax=Natrinema saccharevitans TaxID=301967 RepID=UPI0011157F44|nr:hypothetical protein [Natrinema saccharevitans]